MNEPAVALMQKAAWVFIDGTDNGARVWLAATEACKRHPRLLH